MTTEAEPVTGHRFPVGDARPAGPGTRTVALVLLVGGLVGFAAAFVLAVEKYWLLTNPFYTPSCSINATVSCGPVMSSDQAAVFGFPNPYLGVAGFAVVAATGAMMLGGARLGGWYASGLQAGVTVAVVFVGWLMVQSLFEIQALCPYCMAVWAATFAVFGYVTIDNARRLGDRVPPGLRRLVAFVARYHSSVLVVWLFAVACLVVTVAVRF